MAIKGANMLATCILTEEDILGNRRKLMLMSVNGLQIRSLKCTEQELFPSFRVATPGPSCTYIEKVHKKGHEVTTTTSTDREKRYG